MASFFGICSNAFYHVIVSSESCGSYLSIEFK
jgi:hypothetical protein